MNIAFERTSEVKKTKKELEKNLDVEIDIKGKKVVAKGQPLNEYEATKVLDAINFGFSAKKALSLKEENVVFRILNIKKFTKKKNLKVVRARIIGKQGKTKKTIENISNAHIIIKDNEIGIIAQADSIEDIVTALTSLIRGTKQSNTYRYLEKFNRLKHEQAL